MVFECFQVHTPDSSRYWIAQSYKERLEKGQEPENIDKVGNIWFCVCGSTRRHLAFPLFVFVFFTFVAVVYDE